MKLLQLQIDNRWRVEDSNEFTLSIGEDRDSKQTFILKPTDKICARILEVLLPEVTEQVSAMFESLLGNEEEPTIEEAAQEAFLDTDDGAYPEDDGPNVEASHD